MGWVCCIVVDDWESRHPLAEGETVVGSDPASGLLLSHPTVSRRHAVLRVSPRGLEVEDLGSTNGTRLGRRPLRAATAVMPGARLTFGAVEATVEEIPDDDLEAAIDLGTWTRTSGGRTPDGEAVTAAETPWTALLAELPRVIDRLVDDRGRGSERILADALSLPPGPEIVTFAERLGELLRQPVRPPIEEPHPVEPPPPPAPASVVPAVRELYHRAARIARGELSVLVLGESGTGKDVFARYLHAASPASGGPFVALNCAALPPNLLEAELFGVEEGAATGVAAREGHCAAAAGGTLFLDEVGDMPPAVQAKVLRVLQERTYHRVGGREERPLEARIVAATNRDPDALRRCGELRDDLYFRLADWEVELPPLRRRRPDIPRLAEHFLRRQREELGRRIRGISRAALDALVGFDWPGNVRQLEQEIARAALLVEPGGLLSSDRLSPEIREAAATPSTLADLLERAERRRIEAALEEHGGDRETAAQVLGISSRTLRRKLAGSDGT